jgi:hypothetical protein
MPSRPDPLAVRVARRYAAIIFRDVPRPSVRVEHSNGGTITTEELRRMLEPQVGVLTKLRFRPSLTTDPKGVEWEALDERAELVTGRLVLHARAREDAVVSWAEVTIDPQRLLGDERTVVGALDPEVQLRHVARLARDLIEQIKRKPTIAVVELVGALATIAHEAEARPR